MKMLTTAATLAAVLVSAGTAMAAPNPSTMATAPPNAGHRGQFVSDQNLRSARRHVERAIDRLQHDTEDYGGHREKAIDDLGLARQYLRQALAFEQSHDRAKGTPNNSTLPIGNSSGAVNQNGDIAGTSVGNGANASGERSNEFERGQAASNANLLEVRRHVEAAIDELNSDRSDYGGFKERAIDRLQAARGELDAALDFVHNPGVRNGGSGQHVSDANLQFVSEHIQSAISRLEQDRSDYGGHRVAAIDDLQKARGFINSALAFDSSHGDKTGVVPNVAPGSMNTLPVGGSTTINQPASNESLADARQHVERAIDALTRDAHDYGGFRVKALDALKAAHTELIQALTFRRTM